MFTITSKITEMAKALRWITVRLTVVEKELPDSVELGHYVVKQYSTLRSWLCCAPLRPCTDHLLGR